MLTIARKIDEKQHEIMIHCQIQFFCAKEDHSVSRKIDQCGANAAAAAVIAVALR